MWSETICPTAWKIRAGGSDQGTIPELVKLNLEKKITHVGYGDWISNQEISFFNDEKAVSQYLDDHPEWKSHPKRKTGESSICKFLFAVQIGDVVVMPRESQGRDNQRVAIGIVTGPAMTVKQLEGGQLRRSVKWISRNVQVTIAGPDLAGSITHRRTISRSRITNATERLLFLAFDDEDPGIASQWSSRHQRRVEELLQEAEEFANQAVLHGDEAGMIRDNDGNIVEGATKQVQVNKYERSKRARDSCIKVHGDICKVCGIDFGEVYGDFADGFIHVHHITPVSVAAREGEYKLNPVEDLVPVCPNCHAMLHKPPGDPYTWEELRSLWQARRNLSD